VHQVAVKHSALPREVLPSGMAALAAMDHEVHPGAKELKVGLVSIRGT
jgi:hypothetical protein